MINAKYINPYLQEDEEENEPKEDKQEPMGGPRRSKQIAVTRRR